MSKQSFSVKIPRRVFVEIMHWVMTGVKDKNEVSGFAEVEYEKGVFTLRRPFLIKQKVHAASTEMDATALCQAETEFFKSPMRMKCHWHSHPNIGVFFSSDDRKLIEQLGGGDWILALVFNEKREIKSGLRFNAEFLGEERPQFVEDIPVSIIDEISTEEIKRLDEEYKKNVEKEVFVYDYYTERYGGKTKRYGRYEKNGIIHYGPMPDDLKEEKAEVDSIIDYYAEKNKVKKLPPGGSGLPPDISEKQLSLNHVDPEQVLDCFLTMWTIGIRYDESDKVSFNDMGAGFAKDLDMTIYNPLYDKAVRGKRQIISAIKKDMDDLEIAYLIETNSAFADFVIANLEELYESGVFDSAIGLDRASISQ